MCTFDQCIFEKYARNLITREAALVEMRDQTIIAQLNSLWAQREALAAKEAAMNPEGEYGEYEDGYAGGDDYADDGYAVEYQDGGEQY
jgi:hypothetical protein